MRFSAVLPFFRRCVALALFAVTAAASALAQQNWRWVNPLPASVQWKDVAFGNGLYVAVAETPRSPPARTARIGPSAA